MVLELDPKPKVVIVKNEIFTEIRVFVQAGFTCYRCKGSMIIDKDEYGEYKICRQCGDIVDLIKPPLPIDPTMFKVYQRTKNKRKPSEL